ncbi:MAG: 50S ribosomal protein L15e [Candidatus Micrarchaeota archaeon]|nr:50S ribosomal protein L15e [Candidatus Micrarchaeota archaeon]
MGAYKYIQENLQKQYKERDAVYRAKILKWRTSAMERVDVPANLPRARRLGYKAKQGYVIVRVRIPKGRRKRRKPMGGRKPRHNYMFVQPQLSHQSMGEQRVNRIYKNCEVLNSYWIGEDGVYKFFEVILADKAKLEKQLPSLKRTGRAFRGLTSSARKSRGIGRGRHISIS